MKKRIELSNYHVFFIIIQIVLLSIPLFYNRFINHFIISAIFIDLILLLLYRFHFFGIYKKDPLYRELKIRKNKFFNMINELNEPLIVIDKKGKIRVVNKKFELIFLIKNIRKKDINDIEELKPIKDIFNETITTKKNSGKDITINENSFICSTVFMKETNEVLIILHNITERSRIEQMKKDFINNLSHELKTPLTSINGFAMTLKDMEKDDKKNHYFDIILRNTNRLKRIVDDLLAISEMEHEPHINKENISLKNFVEKISQLFIQQAISNQIAIRIDIKEDLLINADSFKLEQIFINLIENALKYTDDGEILIKAYNEKENIHIIVSDTGIGIPTNKLDRIFERFVVVSKSRSRKKGGTGLGLSIVKHSVSLHDGKIWCESTEGKGSDFHIVFPII